MKYKVYSWQSFDGSKYGEKLSEEPCELFDDCPSYTTPEMMVKRLMAGGEASEFMLRKSLMSEQEFDNWRQDYACDYIQEYKDLLERQREQYKALHSEPVAKPDEVSSTDKQELVEDKG